MKWVRASKRNRMISWEKSWLRSKPRKSITTRVRTTAAPRNIETQLHAPLYDGLWDPAHAGSFIVGYRTMTKPNASANAPARYRRILVKLSGEALLGSEDYGIDPKILKRIAGEIRDLTQMGVQVAVVLGGGNIFRGAGLARAGMDRVTADHMGMLATVINALALQDALEAQGIYARVMSALRINEVCEDYIRRRAVRHLEKGRVVIFGAGTGNPFFTTDTAASLRAIEINAEILLKATKVNGIYDSDPVKNPAAKRYARLTFDQVLNDRLNVMDATAIVMCRENNLPLQVFNLFNAGDLVRIVQGEDVGTVVTAQGPGGSPCSMT